MGRDDVYSSLLMSMSVCATRRPPTPNQVSKLYCLRDGELQESVDVRSDESRGRRHYMLRLLLDPKKTAKQNRSVSRRAGKPRLHHDNDAHGDIV